MGTRNPSSILESMIPLVHEIVATEIQNQYSSLFRERV